MNKSGCRAGNSTASASSLHRMVFARRRVQRLTLLIHECTGRVLICSTSHHNLVHVAAGGLGCQPSGLPTALHRPGRQCLPTSHARSWYSVRRAGVQQPAHGLHQTAMPGVVLMRRQSCSTTQHACSTGCPCICESACAGKGRTGNGRGNHVRWSDALVMLAPAPLLLPLPPQPCPLTNKSAGVRSVQLLPLVVAQPPTPAFAVAVESVAAAAAFSLR